VKTYAGLPLSRLGVQRLHPQVRQQWGGQRAFYSPAYDVLHRFIRRVNIEDQVSLPAAGEYHADTSELVQMLQAGHCGVRLSEQEWQRIVTWIDLNGPCHGEWASVAQPPEQADRKRRDIARRYAGSGAGPGAGARSPALRVQASGSKTVRRSADDTPGPSPEKPSESLPSGPGPWGVRGLTPCDIAVKPFADGPRERKIDLGEGVTIRLVRVPAGHMSWVDAQTTMTANISEFWMGACEVTNAQLRRFDPSHRSGLFTKRHDDINGPGIRLDGDDQPAVRVSWRQATAFCERLSKRTGRQFSLPTEHQWEWACRAGAKTEFSFGPRDADFSPHANLADASLARPGKATGGLELLLDIPCETRCDDGAVATAPVGRYKPNAWGLYDMHGNAAEWTLTPSGAKRVVRGGSFYDRPHRSTSGFRLAYPEWQRVHDVGFRMVAP